MLGTTGLKIFGRIYDNFWVDKRYILRWDCNIHYTFGWTVRDIDGKFKFQTTNI